MGEVLPFVERLVSDCPHCGHRLGKPWPGRDDVRCGGCGARIRVQRPRGVVRQA